MEDRLSSLPNSTLHHILSLTPTKYAVRTSVLSKRWKHLYLGVSAIDIDEDWFLRINQDWMKHFMNELEDRSIYENREVFINFVNKKLMLCETSFLTEFRIKCGRLPDSQVINLWINTLILVADLEVFHVEEERYYRPWGYRLCPPSKFFQWETIQVMKLCGRYIVLKVPEFAHFPNLKVLHLKQLDIQIECDGLKFAEDCYPLLEDLRLEEVYLNRAGYKNSAVEISSSTLKILGIISMAEELSRIDIRSPNLQRLVWKSFTCCCCKQAQVNLHERESLESFASADLFVSFINSRDDYKDFKIFEIVRNVRELRFIDESRYDNGIYASWLPASFPNLSKLFLISSAKLSQAMVERSPNLEELDWHKKSHE